MGHDEHLVVRGQLVGVSSLLPTYRVLVMELQSLGLAANPLLSIS